jgi:hypothetical protein
MPRVEVERATPVFEKAKMVHALDCATIVIGSYANAWLYLKEIPLIEEELDSPISKSVLCSLYLTRVCHPHLDIRNIIVWVVRNQDKIRA